MTAVETGLHGLEECAEAVGAKDLFVFRRVEDDRFVHVGGAGRGVGWAGIVELRVADEPLAQAAAVSGVHVVRGDVRHVFGPYHAAAAAVVHVSGDVIVVFGGEALDDVPAGVFETVAEAAADQIEHVSPAKRLADELEVLHALKQLTEGASGSLDDVSHHIVKTAAAALSCEVGLLYREDGAVVVEAPPGTPLPPVDELRAGMGELFARVEELPLCVQDVHALPLPFLAGAGHIRSYYTLAVGAPPRGLLLLLHTDACPRGFTLLCQELGRRLAASADGLLGAAAAREQLQREIERVSASARRDPLTGIGNRLAWDERLAHVHREDRPSAVLVIDLDRLKAANDTRGHDFGDLVITTVGSLLQAVVGDAFLARIGGDEFGVLLEAGADDAARTAGAIRGALAAHPGLDGFALSAAIGFGTAASGGDVYEAVREADERMYADKRARLTARTRLP